MTILYIFGIINNNNDVYFYNNTTKRCQLFRKTFTMYLQSEIKTVLLKMEKLYDSPITLLTKTSGLSRPTVSKFFNKQIIKPSSVETLYELCLDLIEAKEKKRQTSLRREQSLFKESQREPNKKSQTTLNL